MITDNEPPIPLIIDLALTRPKDEQKRAEFDFSYAEFLERTRRYQRLSKNAVANVSYAKGLESKREDFA